MLGGLTPAAAMKLRALLNQRPARAGGGPGGWTRHVQVVWCGSLAGSSPRPHYSGSLQNVPGLDDGDWEDAGEESVVLADLDGIELNPGHPYPAVVAGEKDGVPLYWTLASPQTTKGDLAVHDGDRNVRLPVGEDGQVLTADAAEDLGVKWASVADALTAGCHIDITEDGVVNVTPTGLAGTNSLTGLVTGPGACPPLAIDTEVDSTTTETLLVDADITLYAGKVRLVKTKVTYTNHFNALGVHIDRTAGEPVATNKDLDLCDLEACCAAEELTAECTRSDAETDTETAVDFTVTPSGGVGPYTYLWTFGDGETSTDQNPSHTYEEAGPYSPSVTVTDACGTEVTCGPGTVTVAEPAGCEPTTLECGEFTSGTNPTVYLKSVTTTCPCYDPGMLGAMNWEAKAAWWIGSIPGVNCPGQFSYATLQCSGDWISVISMGNGGSTGNVAATEVCELSPGVYRWTFNGTLGGGSGACATIPITWVIESVP
ncbi:PKD domain-containing protein [Gemmata sp.]|uniref:PKD domain-containing protein n=1 Tax=Gemmata sp. TaxID=1914242 RepID=UPI003F6EB92C